MGQVEFGKLVSQRMDQVGISQRRLASRLGELSDGSLFDSTSIRTIREGQRRLNHELVNRLIEILSMDPDEAWAASGLLPPGVTAEELRQLRSFRRAAVVAGEIPLTRRYPVGVAA
jgi:transcriptional regulator with XRE-family HTH domain